MPGFPVGANTFNNNGNAVPSDVVVNVQTITGDGAVTIKSGIVILSKGSAAAITIAVPDQDGQVLFIVTSTAQAHVITQATDGFNAKGSSGTCTYTAAVGNAVTLVSQGGHWWATTKTGVTLA